MIDSFYSSQFAKSLFAPSDAVINPVGMKFEIVPLKNPYTLKADGLLPIKVLFEGKPLEGAAINLNAHKEAAKTDRDGIANIPIAGQGMQVISATYRVATKDNPDADYLSFTTVLTMGLK